MTVYLLDVNVLIALHDGEHDHYAAAHQWFETIKFDGWATCPFTESGFIRIVSNPKYPRLIGDSDILARILERTCRAGAHEFWPASLSIRDVLSPGLSVNHDKLTDLYLLALAVAHGGKLATFDGKIPATSLPGGPEALETIPVTRT